MRSGVSKLFLRRAKSEIRFGIKGQNGIDGEVMYLKI